MNAIRTKANKITSLINRLLELMETKIYWDELLTNELFTRYILIDPLLRALGWNTSDPDQVWPEYKVNHSERKRADYALCKDGKIVALIEAKRVGTTSQPSKLARAKNQVTRYSRHLKIPLLIVTDGGGWFVYNMRNGRRKATEVLVIDFQTGKIKALVNKFMLLAPENIGEL
jgi:predicted type IV restriction endonuclease